TNGMGEYSYWYHSFSGAYYWVAAGIKKEKEKWPPECGAAPPSSSGDRGQGISGRRGGG
ncbi:unnamed protein product, partial [marine sediment metagenome]